MSNPSFGGPNAPGPLAFTPVRSQIGAEGDKCQWNSTDIFLTRFTTSTNYDFLKRKCDVAESSSETVGGGSQTRQSLSSGVTHTAC